MALELRDIRTKITVGEKGERTRAWNLGLELEFIAQLGTYSDSIHVPNTKTLLRRYDKALDRRVRWWPGIQATDYAALKQAVSERLEEYAR